MAGSDLSLVFVCTALTLQFVTNTFQEDHDPTIGEYRLADNEKLTEQSWVGSNDWELHESEGVYLK